MNEWNKINPKDSATYPKEKDADKKGNVELMTYKGFIKVSNWDIWYPMYLPTHWRKIAD